MKSLLREIVWFWFAVWSIMGPFSFLAWTDFVHNWSGNNFCVHILATVQ